MDEYQKAYLEHRARKSEDLGIIDNSERQKQIHNLQELSELLEQRRSQRRFTQEPLTEQELDLIMEAVQLSPSSCNRHGIYLVDGNKYFLSQVLVGGKQWIMNADKVYLLMGAKECYKNISERAFMPYLDAGFVAENIYLMSEALDIGCCFVNPNIREHDQLTFSEMYGDDYFCGAIVLGNYNRKAEKPPVRSRESIIKDTIID